jgi:alpha-mannosidase
MDQAMDKLLGSAGPMPRYSGDWPDYWADGVASTAFETAIARAGERIVPITDLMSAVAGQPDDPAQTVAVQSLSLYDEHTWGAYSSVTLPNSPFTRFQQSWKLHQAHDGFATALEAASRVARARARALTGRPIENDQHVRGGSEPAIPIEAQSYYVFNPSPVTRQIRWPVPCDYGGASPASILHGWLTEEFIPGMNVQRNKRMPSPTHVIDVTLPAFAEAIVHPVAVGNLGQCGADWIQNDHWRLQVDPQTGSVLRLTDLNSGRDIGLGASGLGAVLYEVLEDPARGRAAIFGRGDGINDWTRPESTLCWPPTTTAFRRSPASQASLGSPRLTLLGPEIDVQLIWPHGDVAILTWRLPLAGPGIDLTASFAKTRVTTPESFFIVFSLQGANPAVDLDIGDLTVSADETLPAACQTWAAVQRQATLATDSAALAVASPDAPLLHPFGPQTEGAGQRHRRDAALGFWVMNNHWDVNFAAGQSGTIPFRFHLLPMAGPDRAAATAFAEAATTPPVIVRTQDAAPRAPAPLVRLTAPAPLDLRIRPHAPGVILASLANRGDADVLFNLGVPGMAIQRATVVSPTGEALVTPAVQLATDVVAGQVPARSTLRLRLEVTCEGPSSAA